MSEATHYWPVRQEIGTHYICHQDGTCFSWYWNGRRWWKDMLGDSFTQAEMIANGHLGVRREAEKPDDAATAQQALDEWRTCKQQPKAADWAYQWAVDLCERLGAR